MAIVNLMAILIAVFSAVYAIVFAFYGMDVYLHLIVVNLLLVAVALLVPLAHRISDIARPDDERTPQPLAIPPHHSTYRAVRRMTRAQLTSSGRNVNGP